MTAVLVSEDTKVIGIIGITDELRADSKTVIDALKKLNVTPVMLTGDNQKAAQYIGKHKRGLLKYMARSYRRIRPI